MNGNKWFLLVVIGAALILGTAGLALAQESSAAADEVEAANLALAEKFVVFEQNVASYVADLNQFRAEFLDLFRTDLLYHDWGNSQSWNSQYIEFYRWYRAITQAFPDRAFTAENVVAQGDEVYIHYTWTGTFTNTLFHTWITLQPTGKQVVEEGVVIFRIQDGKIAEEWWYPDNPLYWAATALNLERGINTDQPVQEIYNLNKPK